MFKVTRLGSDRLNIEFDGSLNSDTTEKSAAEEWLLS